jgi:ferredoxin like protein
MSDDKQNLSLEDKLYRTKYEPDAANPHIVLDNRKGDPEKKKALLKVCPAEVYKPDPNDPDSIAVSHENCLECGTCRQIVDDEDVLKWKQPDGGMGVKYRHG